MPAVKNEACSSTCTTRALERRVVQRRDVPEVDQAEPEDEPGQRVRERAERALDALQPARGRAHDHAAEREQEEQRRDVAEQDVLEHVGREEVVLAEAVDRGGEGREQREDRAGEARAPGARPAPRPPASLARRRGSATDVDRHEHRDRRQDRRIRQPVDLRVASPPRIVAAAVSSVVRSPSACSRRVARGAPLARRAAALLGLRRRRPRRRPALPPLPRRAALARTTPGRGGRRPRPGRRSPTTARRGRWSAASSSSGRAGLAERWRRRSRRERPAGWLRGAGGLVPGPAPPRAPAAARLQPGGAAGAGARRAHRPARSRDCLRALGLATDSGGRGRRERLARRCRVAFALARPRRRARALLVDDVITTGATLSACAARAAGARLQRGGGLAYARTPGR